jgi:anti-sigma28 factor (negative regulator of flagellin synthesis)
MKIDDRVANYMALLNGVTVSPVAKSGESSGSPASAQKSPIEVDLSSTAVELADDESRRDRLDVIRQQLAEGSYTISGKDVANKILNILKG